MVKKFQNKLSIMNRYTIYCTPEQIKRALELGAPIEVDFQFNFKTAIINRIAYIVPTAEQMIGWLEENGILDIVISRRMSPKTYGYTVWFSENTFVQEKHSFTSRREATLVAIDVALEYLENQIQ